MQVPTLLPAKPFKFRIRTLWFTPMIFLKLLNSMTFHGQAAISTRNDQTLKHVCGVENSGNITQSETRHMASAI